MKFLKTGLLILTILICFLPFNTSKIYGQTIFNINDVLELMKQKYASIEDYEGSIVYYTKTKYSTTYTESSGKIYYKYPNKLRVIFDKPYDWEIVTNGKFLWVYLSTIYSVIKQDLDEDFSMDIDNSKKSLSYLTTNYMFRFLEEKTTYDFNGFKVYKLYGLPISVNAGFKRVDIYVSQDGFIVYQSGETKAGKQVVYYFTNVAFNTDIADNFFEYENYMPPGAQIIENGLD